MKKTSSRATKPHSLAFDRAIVLFADLLGFSKLVEAVEDLTAANELVKKLDGFAAEFTEEPELDGFYGRKYWIFSDSIVAAWSMRSQATATMTEFDALLLQLSGIAAAQGMLMIRDRQLVRGGIGRGWLREDKDTVVSSALVKAARLEKCVVNPFIAVEAELHTYFVEHNGREFYAADIDPIHKLFIPPSDYTNGLPALDYFLITLDEIDLNQAQMRQAMNIASGEERDNFRSKCWWGNRLHYVRSHRQFIVEGLKSPVEKVRLKYEALREHHNRRVAEHFEEADLAI
jgi:hypothetical protein